MDHDALYVQAYSTLFEYVTTNGVADLTFDAFPQPLSLTPLVLAIHASTDLANDSKLNDFRLSFQAFISNFPSSVFMNDGYNENWWTKDIVQLLVELILLVDIQNTTVEVSAVLLQLVLSCGSDAISAIRYLLVVRSIAMYGRGGTHPDETAWLATRAEAVIGQATEYLLSEHAGDLSLLDIVNAFGYLQS